MSLQDLTDMLNKQKLVDGMVLSQNMHKQEVVATLLQKQHNAELLKFIEKQSASELSSHLEELPLDDAQKVWRMIPSERENDVLWELSNERRSALAGDRQPDFEDSRVHIYALVDGRLKSLPISKRQDLEGAK
ncbi:MAG: magnesium transporter MgtE N-terminal domain-containing protein, partial [Polynucleobacter victoriensis]